MLAARLVDRLAEIAAETTKWRRAHHRHVLRQQRQLQRVPIYRYQDAFPAGTTASAASSADPGSAPPDVTLNKSFNLPWGNHELRTRGRVQRLQLRQLGHLRLVRFVVSPSAFGELSKAGDARVLQLALRYSF